MYWIGPGQAVIDRLRKVEAAVPKMYNWLVKHAGKGDFMYTENRKEHVFALEDPLRHVFFDHTHVKFDNYEYEGIRFHNTGALTHTRTSKPDGMGML